MIIQGEVGPASSSSISAGVNINLRQGQLGELVVQQLHGRMYETTYRGNMYCAYINALTLASTHATPLAAGTGTPIIGLHNPIGSGVNLVIQRTAYNTTSGTPGGPLLYNLIVNPQNITAASAGTYFNCASLQQAGARARLFNNTATTGSTAGTALRTIGGTTTTAAAAGNYLITDNVEGAIIVPQGLMLGLACTAAGTTHIISAFMEWEEVPA